MIATGSGIAPFRGFLHDLKAEGSGRRKAYLFFGCTGEDVDFLFRDELVQASSVTPTSLQKLVLAFSREGSEQIYVQHKLLEHADEIRTLLEAGLCIYVCGHRRMGRSVREVLCGILGQSTDFMRLMRDSRYIEEVW